MPASILERACELGHADSCARAGDWLLRGTDAVRGLELMRHACELGEASACDALSDLGVSP